MVELNQYESVGPDVRERIDVGLREIEHEHDIRILFAVESGSRAWGFDSADSDYDVRFVYMHRPEWYLTTERRRDVIDLPIEGGLDFHGWDIRKALTLLVNGNAVLVEWLFSPIVYRDDPGVIASLHQHLESFPVRQLLGAHYCGFGSGVYQRHIRGHEWVQLKKYLYVVRPALVLAWLRKKRKPLPLPVHFSDLLQSIRLPEDVRQDIHLLRKLKKAGDEDKDTARRPIIDCFCKRQMRLGFKLYRKPKLGKKQIEKADRLLREIISGDYRVTVLGIPWR